MKKDYLFLAVAMLLSFSASAQMVPTTKKECTRRCTATFAEASPKAIPYQEKIKEVKERKKAETDVTRLKQLEIEEQIETEKLENFVEKRCTFICRGNPDD